MDPKNSGEHDSPAAQNPGYTFLLMAFFLKTASWMIGVVGDGATLSDDHSSRSMQALTQMLSGPMVDITCVIMIITAGFFLCWPKGSVRSHANPHEMATPPKIATLPMTEAARSAEKRLNGLIAQFRSIPGNMVLPEASVEFERIESKHLLDLQVAHREARSTVSVTSAKADALDADYAAMLGRLSDTVERLIESCEALGRERLEVQRRFIEARHSTDNL